MTAAKKTPAKKTAARTVTSADLSAPGAKIDALVDSLVDPAAGLDPTDVAIVKRRAERDLNALVADRQRAMARQEIENQCRGEALTVWTETGDWREAYAVLEKYAPAYVSLAPLARVS
jgi:hypothetical protein